MAGTVLESGSSESDSLRSEQHVEMPEKVTEAQE